MFDARNRLTSISILSVALIALGCDGGPSPSPSSNARSLANRMASDPANDWFTVQVAGARLHARRGKMAASDLAHLGDSVAQIRRELLALFDGNARDTTAVADLFFVESRDETRRLTGAPLMGFVQEDEPAGVFVFSPRYHMGSLLRHELSHLYAFQEWGRPRAGRWLVEGLAVWAAGPCQGHSADALAAGALQRGALVPLTRLASDFDRLDEDVKMPMAGSIVGFVVAQSGLAAIRTLWSTGTPAESLGAGGDRIEREWRDRIRQTAPATLDIPRAIEEGC